MREIASVVRDAIPAADLDTLIEILSTQEHISTIDIIGHTTEEGVMRLGNTSIDQKSIASSLSALRDGLSKCGVSRLRMLGCRSACGRGTAIVVELAAALNLQVFGSTTPLMPRHFDFDGFRPEYDVLLVSDRTLRGVRTAAPR